jgi:hypothetical protein
MRTHHAQLGGAWAELRVMAAQRMGLDQEAAQFPVADIRFSH